MCSELTAPEAKKPAISTNALPPLRQEMVLQVTLVLYSCWLFLRLVRDPVSAFPWILPLARIDHRFGNEGDFGRPERFSESFAIDPVQVE